MLSVFKNLAVREDGQGMVEYGLVFLGVVIVAATVIGLLGIAVEDLIRPVINLF
ncbi:hypothetical protein AB1282_08300 [Gottfriedia sp. S16(2024)]|uniref:Flp family type IVb pilin n=1 Tax=Gottfriedia sp. S16(2024) TaxID=3162883 RepID=UPI003D2430D8